MLLLFYEFYGISVLRYFGPTTAGRMHNAHSVNPTYAGTADIVGMYLTALPSGAIFTVAYVSQTTFVCRMNSYVDCMQRFCRSDTQLLYVECTRLG